MRGFFVVKVSWLALAFCAFPALSSADWHPVITGGAGVSIPTNLGKSKAFPIQDPETDEEYNYTPKHETETRLYLEAFAGVEWSIFPCMSVQVGLNYNQSRSFTVNGTFLQGADVISQNLYAYHYKMITRQLLVEGKLLFDGLIDFHPYVSFGLGSSFNKAYNYSTNVPSTLTFTRMYQNNNTSSFSYNVGVGLDYEILSHFRIGIGYRFTDLGKVSLGPATIDTSSVSGTLSQDYFYSNVVLGEVSYVF